MAKSNQSGTTTTSQSAYETSGRSEYGSSSSSSSGTRERFSDYGQSASRRIDNSPLIAVGAGVALGAVLGAVLPASRKETELLRPIGNKLTDAGYGAADRAREMGKQKFDEMAGDKVREFFGAAGGSSSSSSSGSSSTSSNA